MFSDLGELTDPLNGECVSKINLGELTDPLNGECVSLLYTFRIIDKQLTLDNSNKLYGTKGVSTAEGGRGHVTTHIPPMYLAKFKRMYRICLK